MNRKNRKRRVACKSYPFLGLKEKLMDIKFDYPYLELDLIDFIYNCPDQFLTTDEVLEYIQEEYGEKEYLNA